MLGPRDHALRRTLNLASLADRGVSLRGHDAIAADPAQVAREAVEHVRHSAPAWWLHTDLDVLAQDIFTAGRVPDDEDEPGGLDWRQLTELTAPRSPAAAVPAGASRSMTRSRIPMVRRRDASSST